MKKNKRAYLASPYGFSEAWRAYYYEQLIPTLNAIEGLEIIDPWVLTPASETDAVAAMPYGEARKEAWAKLSFKIGENNTNALKTADLVIAVLDGTDVDSGTAAEIGYATALDIPVWGYRNDFRFAGDNDGTIVNLQVEYFILKNGGRIAGTLLELKELFTNC